MCGIAGIIAFNDLKVDSEQLVRMTTALAHRGHDGDAKWINNNHSVGFGHRRLSIIDLSETGAQPMHYLDRYTIVYNGEIYNYLELRDILVSHGYRFRSQSDTEVILAAYDHWKDDCLEQFDGMFAFAIWDAREQLLFAARDRFGEKPFYYSEDTDRFSFASEMKALWSIGIDKKPDQKMLLNYLVMGHVQNPVDKAQTFFENIHALPPAHFLQLNYHTGKLNIFSYWKIDKDRSIGIAPTDAVERFTELFTKSVTRRLRSDVSVGTSLSGGLDSSSIAATIHKIQSGSAGNQSFKTFSAVFPGFAKDESKYIRLITDKFQLQNFQVAPSADGLITDFEKLCYHQEEPFQSSSIYAQFRVFELAKQQDVKVLLDGQGADETLAGYNRYIHWYLQQLASRWKLTSVAKERKKLNQKKIDFKWSGMNYLAAIFPSHAAVRLERNEYRRQMTHPDIRLDFINGLRGREWEGIHKPIITKLNDILNFNTNVLGLEELLRFADRNSMAHGREVRLPFLNHELVEFIFALPAWYKIHDGWTKWLLRQSMDQQLPSETVWRTDKVGYEPPQQQWMENNLLKDYIVHSKKILVDKGVLKSSVIDKKITSMPAHHADNFDWRYLTAAQLFKPVA